MKKLKKNEVRFNGIIDIDFMLKDDILSILKLMKILKESDYNGSIPQLLKNKTLAMLFETASTRTRISFETAMTKLGGHAQYLKPGEIHLGKKESLYDTIKVLSRLTDIIFYRGFKHETLLSIEKYADVPVINGLAGFNHPTQVFGDFLSIFEHKPKNKDIKNLKLVFIGDKTDVCKSLMSISSKIGINFVHIAPKKYQSPNNWIEQAKKNLKNVDSGSVMVTENFSELKNADFVYTDVWWWYGQEDTAFERFQDFTNGGYRLDNEVLKLVGHENYKVMHNLPCFRNVELSDDVFDGKNSIIFDQSENKLYSAMGLLTWYLYPQTLDIDNKKQEKYKTKILKIFKNKLNNKNNLYKKYTHNNDYKNKIDYFKDYKNISLKKEKN